MDIFQWLTNTPAGEFCFTALVSMIPVVELRGGIPFGVLTCGLPVWAAYLAAVNRLVDRMEKKAHLKGNLVTKYKYLGLVLFVAIPLPGTGAWTGSLAAAFLDMPLRKALPSIFIGIIVAGIAISILTFGVSSLF